MTTATGSHWLTRFDPDDGEPYGTLCWCTIGEDHDSSAVEDPFAVALANSDLEPECPGCNADNPDDRRDGCEDVWHAEAQQARDEVLRITET